jgi:hypothetical protein
MIGKGNMVSGGHSSGKSPSPQESRLSVGQNMTPAPFETFAPGIVGQSEFDGASLDTNSPFTQNEGTLGFFDQMRTLSETPQTAAEQFGIPRSQKPQSGEIFNGKDFKKRKQLNALRAQNPEIAQKPGQDQVGHGDFRLPEREVISTTRMSAERYAQIRQDKTAEQRQKLLQLQRSHKTITASGGLNLTHNVTATPDSNESGLLRFALKRFNAIINGQQKSAAELARQRRGKLAAARQGGLDMGGKERTYGSVEYTQMIAGHEMSGNDMGD